MHSSLPLQITDWKFSRSPRVVNLFRWIEKVSVRGACAVVAISPAVERAAKQVAADVHSVVIVNHFEIGETGPEDAGALIRQRHGITPENRIITSRSARRGRKTRARSFGNGTELRLKTGLFSTQARSSNCRRWTCS
jgi:hypothetical protein